MEVSEKAKGYVLRSGLDRRLERVCGASVEKIDVAIRSLAAEASIGDVQRSPEVNQDAKDVLLERVVFASEVIGSDGARAKLRHEPNGYALMFGSA